MGNDFKKGTGYWGELKKGTGYWGELKNGTGYWGELKKGTGYWGKSKIRNDENTGIFKPEIPIIPKIPRGKNKSDKVTKRQSDKGK